MPGPENDRCAICNGTRQEHGPSTAHVFTMTPGDLRVPEPPKLQKPTPRTPHELVIERLIGLLIDKDVILESEGLRCFGVTIGKIVHPPMSDERVRDTNSDMPSVTQLDAQPDLSSAVGQ